jgi:hypothetical protein
MMFTARQLEALWKTEGKIVLPYRARLTPLAKDWVRSKKITLGYGDVTPVNGNREQARELHAEVGKFLWWCDGPCGIAKAALATASQESALEPMAILEDATRVMAAVRHLVREIKEKRTSGAILVTGNTAAAGMYSNRSPLLRAIVGTSLAQVERAIKELAANVLIVEADKHTLMQLKTMFTRFVKVPRTSNEAVERELNALSAR